MHILSDIALLDHVVTDHIQAMDDIQPYHSIVPSPTLQATRHILNPKSTRTQVISKRKSTPYNIVKKGTEANNSIVEPMYTEDQMNSMQKRHTEEPIPLKNPCKLKIQIKRMSPSS